jgi:MFS family permease
MNGLQALHQWQTYMGSPTGARLGFINAIYWLGVGISYPIAAWVANKFGRKPGVYIGYLLLVLGVALLAGPRGAFVASRFFVGCASAWFGNAVPLLINEIAYPTHRGIANALFMCGWYVGGTVAGFVTFGTRNYIGDWAWRIPGVLQVLLPALALPGFILCHESPRWLVSMNREEDARKVLTSAHGGGDPMSALVNYEMIEITETLRAEQEAEKQSAGYAEMWKTPGNRRRLLISVTLGKDYDQWLRTVEIAEHDIGIFSQWSGNGVVSYYLALVLDTVGVKSVKDQTLIAGCLQIWNLIFAVAAAFSVDRVGRRPLFLASAVTMFIGYVCVTGLSGSFAQTGNAATGTAVIPFLVSTKTIDYIACCRCLSFRCFETDHLHHPQ